MFRTYFAKWLCPLLLVISASAAAQHQHGAEHDDDATAHHRFSDAQSWADHFEDPARAAWQLPDSIVALLATADDLVVADIGSATGYFTVRFARTCPNGRVFGADIEPEMVWYLNERSRREGLPNLVSILAAPDDPHLPARADLVFICDTFHHIDDRVDYFTRLKAQLSPDARVAVVDFRPSSNRGPAHKVAPDSVEAEMNEAGYALAEHHDFLPDQYFLVFEAREASDADGARSDR